MPADPKTTDLLPIARAIHEGLGPSWAYANYGGDEWNSMRAELLSAAANVVKLLQVDPDCQRCRGGGCDWCGNTGHARILMPLSDANDLDAVIHALGIEDSDTTPAEAVAELHTEIERLRARVMELERGN